MSLNIIPVLCRAGSMDNYCYIITDTATRKSAIVDASEAQPIISACQRLDLKPSYILNTHHHFDHTDANQELKDAFGCQVVGNAADAKRIPAIDITVKTGETFALGQSAAQIIDAPGHTHGHILWYFPQDKALFTGDTLFNLCIGGLFEGTPTEMFNTLQTIKQLPDDTLFYPGHEYTLSGLNTALHFNQSKPEMQEYLALIRQRLNAGQGVPPIPLRLEKACNPYLNAATPAEFTAFFR